MSVEPIGGSGHDDAGGSISGTERAIYGPVTAYELRAILDRWARTSLNSAIEDVRFRAGRIDVVWGVRLENGQSVVIKTYRPPVDMDALRAAHDAQRALATAGFPCALPLAGPDEVGGRVLTAESLMEGTVPNGRDPAIRMLLAEGLSRQIEILRRHPDLASAAGRGPSWCQYRSGPWPTPHDTIVDFRSTPGGYEWLDLFGQRAADQILHARDFGDIVVGHAGWYAGNNAVSGDELVGTFDWVVAT